MGLRRTRVERSEENRAEVLAAARRVFLERGWAGATLDAIADSAGFTKGVVYSRFGSKADLMLALLEERVSERAGQNLRAVEKLRGLAGLCALIRSGRTTTEEDAGWGLLLLEFRLHAARDQQLNRRYLEVHRRAIEALAELIARLLDEARIEPVASPRVLAALMLTFAAGALLEKAADARAIPPAEAEAALARAFGLPKEE